MSVYIFDAVRTPRGKGRPDGSLAGFAPSQLVAQLVRALERRNGRDAVRAAEHFTLGCVTQVGGQGGHIALASRIQADLPDSMACLTINNFCVSGLSALADAARRVASGQAELALAGGVESMSRVVFLADQADYYADMALAGSMGWAPVGVAADLLATREGLARPAMDAAVLRSHGRAAQAWDRGFYDGRVIPVQTPDGTVALARDENIRDFGDGASLARLGPVFAAPGAAGFDEIILTHKPEIGAIQHLHTVAHCPPISDGASLLLLGTREAGKRLGLTPLARIRAVAEAADDHVMQLTAGYRAMTLVLERADMTLSDMGAIEFMEAFAAVPVLFERDFEPDMARVNPNGGHLAMGHPMGATGAILTTTLLDDMVQLDADTGLVVATGGVGVGAAMVLERLA
ncbi:MAG: acetyl-CoA C-acyltransferase [Alphaproteobacteria bacterium]|nr:acetyl-CoA C-acyltransferase [Alphaproteobacteria bacterium]MBU1513079.1 acetyl-CoA C-acyltransferase [Alphaproteobacteria bacterium]MBU2095187.1 acetyl-CoA C-acyltransferase [Alphaproteobacteria bacterium]MBU2150654.1 acetyl-CoA C-acyltransferase [Alphaproteobacteria bacterium]MBU2306087.1 acetyl-CoA C-acyltransferase [Alphaproteobacteria bacterium]